MREYIFKGSKETRLLAVDDINETYVYMKIGNEKLTDMNFSTYETTTMKNIESMKIRLYVDDYEMIIMSSAQLIREGGLI